MAGTLHDHSVLPEHREQIAKVRAFFQATDWAAASATLASADRSVTLPPEMLRGIWLLVDALADGDVATVNRLAPSLTTQEVADLLGVSRPTVIRLLDQGLLPCTSTSGGHRRVRQSDVLAFLRREKDSMRRGMDEIVGISEELGLYDDGFPSAPHNTHR